MAFPTGSTYAVDRQRRTPRSAQLVIASNRGMVGLRAAPDGRIVGGRGAGGLVNVLGPAAASRQALWIAAALTAEDRVLAGTADAAEWLLSVEIPEGRVRFRLLSLAPADYEAYYQRIATEGLWFLHHGMVDLMRQPASAAAQRADWQSYRRVNRAFAAACAEDAKTGGRVLIQDYHLSLVPRQLREARPDVGIAHFTMVPWAEPAALRSLPDFAVRDLLDGLLGADMACFLVPRWADAFLRTCEAYGHDVDHGDATVGDRSGRRVAVRSFPVGVDPARLLARAAQPDVAAQREALGRMVGDRRFVVIISRMDPSKNVLGGIDAFGALLQRHPALRRSVMLYVLAYASRSDLPAYLRYADEVARRTRAVNERFGTASWQPILLETQDNPARGLAAMMLADVLVVNSVRDGMNLVAKEGPVLSERALALVLSTEAGAVDDLADGALLVDPADVTAQADAIAAALAMDGVQRAERLERLRRGAGALPPERWLAQSLAELERVLAGPRAAG